MGARRAGHLTFQQVRYCGGVHAWNETSVPALPGESPTPKIYNSTTGEFAPAPSGGLYVCGITPYDATHLGHASTYVTYDTLVRIWADGAGQFTYVQNVTDIDDPLLERAQETGEDWRGLAESQTDLFRADMEALSVIPPTHYVGVVETMDLIAEGVARMLEAGAAYWVGGDLYADLSVDDMFGTVGNLDARTQMEFFRERGGDPDTPGKRDPLDPLLWRGARDGEPQWDGGVLGPGRPGWHIECAIIARKHLAMPFVVQGGGEDLVFPHHEMSLSHLRVLTEERRPAQICMHTALIAYEGEKMSKSLGNLIFVSKLREEGVKPDAIRLLLLGHHYRHPWEYTDDKLRTSVVRLEAWLRAMADHSATEGITGAQVLDRVREHLANDLDTPAALAVVDEWVRNGRKHLSDRTLVADLADALLGIKGLRRVVAAA